MTKEEKKKKKVNSRSRDKGHARERKKTSPKGIKSASSGRQEKEKKTPSGRNKGAHKKPGKVRTMTQTQVSLELGQVRHELWPVFCLMFLAILAISVIDDHTAVGIRCEWKTSPYERCHAWIWRVPRNHFFPGVTDFTEIHLKERNDRRNDELSEKKETVKGWFRRKKDDEPLGDEEGFLDRDGEEEGSAKQAVANKAKGVPTQAFAKDSKWKEGSGSMGKWKLGEASKLKKESPIKGVKYKNDDPDKKYTRLWIAEKQNGGGKSHLNIRFALDSKTCGELSPASAGLWLTLATFTSWLGMHLFVSAQSGDLYSPKAAADIRLRLGSAGLVWGISAFFSGAYMLKLSMDMAAHNPADEVGNLHTKEGSRQIAEQLITVVDPLLEQDFSSVVTRGVRDPWRRERAPRGIFFTNPP